MTDVLAGRTSEQDAWKRYVRQHRKRFTLGFLAGYAIRGAVKSGVLDAMAAAYDNPTVRRAVVRTLGSALAGTSVHEAAAPATPVPPPQSTNGTDPKRRGAESQYDSTTAGS